MSFIKKVLLRILLCFAVAAIVVVMNYVFFSGNGLPFGNGNFEDAEEAPRVAFGNVELSDDSGEKVMTEEELLKKAIIADDYRGDLHYNTLSEKEQTVYSALEYALENGYRYVYIDDLLISQARELEKIVQYLALDSPLLEQNLTYGFGSFTLYYEPEEKSILGGKKAFDGYYICVENFAEAFWDKKEQAIGKAEEIIANMPQGMNEIQTAEYLHRYTVENVIYYDYIDQPEGTIQSYLYDGLISGRTHCDGSANMYSLLMNMAGIECIEKQYTGSTVEIGHTWNMAKLDGEWYNIDATAGADSSDAGYELILKRVFGFDDRMQRFTPDYKEIYPDVPAGIGLSVDAHLDAKFLTADLIRTVRTAYSSNGNVALILLDMNYMLASVDIDPKMQELANAIGKDIHWLVYEAANNRTALLIYS